MTIWLGLLGFGFDRGLWELPALACLLVVAFALIDSYHARLYVQALAHATKLEQVSRTYFTALTLAEDDPDLVGDFRDELDALRLGLYSSFTNPRRQAKRKGRWRRLIGWLGLPWSYIWNGKPRVFFRMLYPALILIALGACFLVPTRATSEPAERGAGAHKESTAGELEPKPSGTPQRRRPAAAPRSDRSG